MRKLLAYLLVFSFFLSCGSSQQTTQKKSTNEEDKVVIKNEELEYEIIIFEPGFNSWLVTQQPMTFFTQPFLEQRNLRYVTTWNQRALQPGRFGELYVWQIDYNSNIDYGMEVNYMLFMYFRYFQQKYRQQL